MLEMSVVIDNNDINDDTFIFIFCSNKKVI